MKLIGISIVSNSFTLKEILSSLIPSIYFLNWVYSFVLRLPPISINSMSFNLKYFVGSSNTIEYFKLKVKSNI